MSPTACTKQGFENKFTLEGRKKYETFVTSDAC